MKRFIAAMGIMVLAGLLLSAVPKNKRRAKSHHLKTINNHVSKNKKQTPPKEILIEFRLEYQQAAGRGCKNSAVLSSKQGEYGDSSPPSKCSKPPSCSPSIVALSSPLSKVSWGVWLYKHRKINSFYT